MLLLGLWGCGHATDPEAGKAEQGGATARVTVSVKPAQQRSMAESVEGLGRCEALPGKIATLTPAVEGRVLKILVGPTADVKPGQAIVKLYPTIAQADLQEKLTSRDALDASLRLLKTLPRPQEQEGRKLAIESAKASLAKVEATANSLRPLRARGDIPEQQMYEAELSVTQARLQLQSAQSELTVLMLGPRPAAIDEAKAHAASAAASIGEIVDLRQVYAAVWLPVDTARRVHQWQPAQVGAGSGSMDRTASNMEASNAPAEWLPGKVDLIGQVVDSQTGNLLVRTLVENYVVDNRNGQWIRVKDLGRVIVSHEDRTVAVRAKGDQRRRDRLDADDNPGVRAVGVCSRRGGAVLSVVEHGPGDRDFGFDGHQPHGNPRIGCAFPGASPDANDRPESPTRW